MYKKLMDFFKLKFCRICPVGLTNEQHGVGNDWLCFSKSLIPQSERKSSKNAKKLRTFQYPNHFFLKTRKIVFSAVNFKQPFYANSCAKSI